jgi:spore maturation protein B
MSWQPLETLSSWALPCLLAAIPLYAMARRVKVYPAFIEGARQGFEVAVRIIPPVVAIMVALGAFRASGALELLATWVAPVADALGLPAPVLPLILVRPLSGGAALGVVGDVLRSEGPDSYAGRLASVMAGSTETTFYVLAVYMGAAGIARHRQALAAGLLADAAGFTAAVIVVRAFFAG